MNSVKLSSNYQIVLPKAVRNKLGLIKGQVLYIKSVGSQEVTLTAQDPVSKYYGILKGTLPIDAVEYQRSIRRDRELPEL